MLSVNTHEAKTRLSELLVKIENDREPVVICRNGRPIAQLIPLPKATDPLAQNVELQKVFFYEDPTLPLDHSEWPAELR
jgi:prevent-host-death family protein